MSGGCGIFQKIVNFENFPCHSTSIDQIFGKVPARPLSILMKICVNVAHGAKLTFLKYFGPTLYNSSDIA